MTPEPTRRYLLDLARHALAQALGVQSPAPPDRPSDPRLERPARVFVSWHLGARLVGCIGTLEPETSLEQAVWRYAVHAGLHDPRTPPARPEELPRLRVEISILGEPTEVPVVGLSAIERTIASGREGVIVHHGARRGVFLPVVWDKLADPREFLLALCRKAGIDPLLDGDEVRASVFTTEVFGDAP